MAKAAPASAPSTPAPRVVRVPRDQDRAAVLAAACPAPAPAAVATAKARANSRTFLQIMESLDDSMRSENRTGGGTSAAKPMGVHPRGRRSA